MSNATAEHIYGLLSPSTVLRCHKSKCNGLSNESRTPALNTVSLLSIALLTGKLVVFFVLPQSGRVVPTPASLCQISGCKTIVLLQRHVQLHVASAELTKFYAASV